MAFSAPLAPTQPTPRHPRLSACLPRQDKDAGSQLAIKSVLFHAKANDAKYGGKRVWLSMPQREQ